MSDEKNTLFLTALLSVLPVTLVLGTDFAMLNQSVFSKAVSHFAFAVLIGQMLNQVVFIYGGICAGQRGRLAIVNLCWLWFWAAWLVHNAMSANHYLLMNLLCLCGIVLTFSAVRQSKNESMRKPVLYIGMLAGGLGLVLYSVMLFDLPSGSILSYNLISQMITGIIAAYLALIISRNRLQEFIALLPFAFIIVLLLNAIAVLILIAVVHFSGSAALQAGIAVYFVFHLILMMIFAYPVLQKSRLSYTSLIFAFCIALGLPFFI